MENILIVNGYLKTPSFKKIEKRFIEAFSARGEILKIINNDKAYELINSEGNGQPVLFFDKDIRLAKLLEKSGYRSINSSKTIALCDDKALTYIALRDKVSIPKTIIPPFTFDNIAYTDYDFLLSAEKDLGFPLIVKRNCGSFGEQVRLVNNRDELHSVVKSMADCNFILQEYIASSYGRDVRVYVVGGKVVACCLRSNQNDFRSNVELGGTTCPYNPKTSFLRSALKAAKVVNADFAGIDVLFSKNGAPFICEINSNAHFIGLEKATGVDVAGAIVDYYLSKKI